MNIFACFCLAWVMLLLGIMIGGFAADEKHKGQGTRKPISNGGIRIGNTPPPEL